MRWTVIWERHHLERQEKVNYIQLRRFLLCTSQSGNLSSLVITHLAHVESFFVTLNWTIQCLLESRGERKRQENQVVSMMTASLDKMSDKLLQVAEYLIFVFPLLHEYICHECATHSYGSKTFARHTQWMINEAKFEGDHCLPAALSLSLSPSVYLCLIFCKIALRDVHNWRWHDTQSEDQVASVTDHLSGSACMKRAAKIRSHERWRKHKCMQCVIAHSHHPLLNEMYIFALFTLDLEMRAKYTLIQRDTRKRVREKIFLPLCLLLVAHSRLTGNSHAPFIFMQSFASHREDKDNE